MSPEWHLFTERLMFALEALADNKVSNVTTTADVSEKELYGLSETFFAQDAWDGAEPHVIAVAFAKEVAARIVKNK
jgi:hypothetical protein